MRFVWAEIDLAAVAHNMREIRRVTRPGTSVMAIVKANAYGHGAVEVSRTALKNGADRLGVFLLEEAQLLRRDGIEVPILVFGYISPDQIGETLVWDVTPAVYTGEQAEAFSRAAVKAGKRARLHIKVDTGMARVGFQPGQQAVRAVTDIASLPGVEIEGIFTHFAVADEVDKSFTSRQMACFIAFIGELERHGLRIPIRHAANSAAVIDLPDTHLDMVRPGIMLYGLYPSGEVRRETVALKPAMALKARVSFVKEVDAGTSISYGRTFVTARRTVVATLPMGYADGYSRLLSNKAEVLLHGRRAPVVGRVCMDQMMVDATGIPGVKTGDEAVLIGQQGTERISADDIACLLGTISYEVTCMVSSRVPRLHLPARD